MLAEYGFFVLRWATVLVLIVFALLVVIEAAKKAEPSSKGKLVVKKLNAHYEQLKAQIEAVVLSKAELKAQAKTEKQQRKKAKSGSAADDAARLYVLRFDGDIQASAVKNLEHEISAVLGIAKAGDEVLLCLESGGGVVHGYGLAASQLQRLRDAGVRLTVAVDKVAASGGYMMAAVANQICAAPFAIIGSIGVIGQVPNVHRLLKKHDIDVEMHTSGRFKRTLTTLGENTDEGREKFRQDLQNIHEAFKQHVQKLRRSLDIETVADGDVWLGQEALEKKLVDRIITSEQLLQELSAHKQLIAVQWKIKPNLSSRLREASAATVEAVVDRIQYRRPW